MVLLHPCYIISPIGPIGPIRPIGPIAPTHPIVKVYGMGGNQARMIFSMAATSS